MQIYRASALAAVAAGLLLPILAPAAAQATVYPNPCSNPITRCLIRPVATPPVYPNPCSNPITRCLIRPVTPPPTRAWGWWAHAWLDRQLARIYQCKPIDHPLRPPIGGYLVDDLRDAAGLVHIGNGVLTQGEQESRGGPIRVAYACKR